MKGGAQQGDDMCTMRFCDEPQKKLVAKNKESKVGIEPLGNIAMGLVVLGR